MRKSEVKVLSPRRRCLVPCCALYLATDGAQKDRAPEQPDGSKPPPIEAVHEIVSANQPAHPPARQPANFLPTTPLSQVAGPLSRGGFD